MKTKAKTKLKEVHRERRHRRVRATVVGNKDIPRLSVTRSLKNIYLQLIDDNTGNTIVAVNDKGLTGDVGDRSGKVASAYLAGKLLAERAKEAGVSSVVFDRGGYKYHGRVKAVAQGAREAGLKF